jgi:uncharacterized protein YlzI (FlbEa/FlbD family)
MKKSIKKFTTPHGDDIYFRSDHISVVVGFEGQTQLTLVNGKQFLIKEGVDVVLNAI